MKNLIQINLNLPIIATLVGNSIMGCTTSSFKIQRETDSLTLLLVTPDRVVLQCEELDEDPDIGAFGFMVHILDEENTVTTSALNIRPDKENCENHIRKITRILNVGEKITIGSRGNLSEKPRTNTDTRFPHTFPGHGTFIGNGRSLDLVYLENEKGQCYGPSYREKEPCPQFPFPID